MFGGMETTERIVRSCIWTKPSVVFDRGCRLLIKAESGCGKSSLLSFIYGNRSDYSGEILFNGQNIRQFDIDHWCNLRINSLALMPQELRLFAELTVMENIELKNRRTNHKSRAQIEALLERLQIADKRDTLLSQLSIGQQQRVALVRAVCQPFDFLLLDEPVSHLDERNNQIAADIVCEEAAYQGAGIVATSVGQNLLLSNAKTIEL